MMLVDRPPTFRQSIVREAADKAVSARTGSVCSRTPCPNLKVDHSDYLSLLRKLREASECEESIYPFRYPF